MGLTGAAVGLNSSIQDMLLARLQQKQYEDKLRQQDFDNQMREKTFASNEELKHAQLDATAESRRGAEEDRKAGLAEKLANTIPADTPMAFTDPAVGKLTAAGYGSLIPDKGLNPQAPASIAEPDAATGDLPGTIANSPFPNGRIVTKRQSFNQQKDAENRAQQETAAQHQADELIRQQARDDETNRHNRAMEGRPQPNATVTIQTVDDAGNPVTRVVPKSEAIGKDYKKGPSATTATRLDSARAVQQTGEDIIRQLSDPAFIAAVGPVMGRASKLADFIGNPPPEFSGLAGQIESYALANMGVHGMRSAQGAAMISKLLDQHHTPESLIATIKGLNGFSQHFLANAGRGGPSEGGAVHMKAPDGRDLQVPAEKVAELERLGAKRMP